MSYIYFVILPVNETSYLQDFESERKWKLAQAKKVALRASKGMLDQATRGEKKLKVLFLLSQTEFLLRSFLYRKFHLAKNWLMSYTSWKQRRLKLLLKFLCVFLWMLMSAFHCDQEEEQRLRKVALNISKDVKKFWIKIEKLVSLSILIWSSIKFCYFFVSLKLKKLVFQVLYKHQMELDEKKKKALDKQLEFLLGQTERWVLLYFILFIWHQLGTWPGYLCFWIGNWFCMGVFRYSTMLAENLVDKPSQQNSVLDQPKLPYKEGDDTNGLAELNDGKVEALVSLLNCYLQKWQMF